MHTLLLTGLAVAGTVLYIGLCSLAGRFAGFNQLGHDPE
jgi:hypothetical protein